MAKSSTAASVSAYRLVQYSLSLISFKIAVARSLSSQKPGAKESCLSWLILSVRLLTSKKPPQSNNAGPHIIKFFLCHSGAKIGREKVCGS